MTFQIEVRQLFPNPGWVEMDPNEIIDTVKKCIEKVVDKLGHLGISTDEIKSVGIANQRGQWAWKLFNLKRLYPSTPPLCCI